MQPFALYWHAPELKAYVVTFDSEAARDAWLKTRNKAIPHGAPRWIASK